MGTVNTIFQITRIAHIYRKYNIIIEDLIIVVSLFNYLIIIDSKNIFSFGQFIIIIYFSKLSKI